MIWDIAVIGADPSGTVTTKSARLLTHFTGGSIYSAMFSGMLAGESISENFDDPSKAFQTYRKKL